MREGKTDKLLVVRMRGVMRMRGVEDPYISISFKFKLNN